MESIKDKIINIAKKLNIDCIGFTSIEDFNNIRPILEKRKEKGYLSGFEEKDIEKRLYPIKTLDHGKSIISIGISYHNKNIQKPKHRDLYGKISKSSWGEDYHRVLENKMNELMEVIKKDIAPINYITMVDTGPLVDRAVANRSGLGNFGKNGFIINPIYGSWIFIGNILVDIEIEEDIPTIGDVCGPCKACIKACPTGAIEEGYVFNAQKCISFLTQKKEILREKERRSIGINIYGCDICQEVCPKNQGARYTNHTEFTPKEEHAFPKIKELLEISNKDFKEKFKPIAGGWRGKKILQRNAIIALGNMKDERAIPILEEYVKDPRWEIRLYSIWALGQYGESTIEIIKERLYTETHPQVVEEIKNILCFL